MDCISFSVFLWKRKTNEGIKIQSKNLSNMKMIVNYLNFVFHIKVKTECKYKVLNFVFKFVKNTKWHFGCTEFDVAES